MPRFSTIAITLAVDPHLNTCLGQPPDGRASREKPSQNTLPEDNAARISLADKRKKSALRGRVSLDNGGPHKY
jgi:hypothetical protein